MEPGRELDALVAEKVMGWKREKRKRWAAQDPNPFYVDVWVTPGGREYEHLPQYSTDIAAAWEVVDRMTKDAYDFFLSGVSPHQAGWAAIFDYGRYGNFSERGETPALAICLAALKAVAA